MIQWEQRPVEIANLLNPAFCGQVLRVGIRAYAGEASTSLPYALAFLLLPIVLHPQTRERLSIRQRQLHTWLQENEDLKIGFAERTRQVVPVTLESITFLLQLRAVAIDEQGGLQVLPYRRRAIPEQEQGEIADCYRKAAVVGRLFARAGNAPTIYALWGVTL